MKRLLIASSSLVLIAFNASYTDLIYLILAFEKLVAKLI